VSLTHRSVPPRFSRLSLALALGVLASCFTLAAHSRDTAKHSLHTDLDETWLTSRALLAGQDPYAVGDSLYQAGWNYPLIYPGTAVLVTAPLAVLPLRWAQAVWNGLGTAALVWVLTQRAWWGIMALGSAAYLSAFYLVQWSPLLIGGLIPGLGFIWAAKPTIGAAFFSGWPSRSAMLGGALLIIISLILIPGWPAKMWIGLRAAPQLVPIISRPGGVLLLLSLMRWRAPEARMLGVLALVPQTTMVYEMLPLFLIPRTLREMAALTLLTQIAFAAAFSLRPGANYEHLPDMLNAHWPFWLVLVYLPALVLVIRRSDSPESPAAEATAEPSFRAGNAS
jgi:hypothetical protein